MSSVKKEFAFTQENFNHIREIVTEHSGIVLSDAKQDMVYFRLVRRLRKTGIKNFDTYCLLPEDQNHEEFTHFINAITTNLTSFFRENHHFEMLADMVLPAIMQRNKIRKKSAYGLPIVRLEWKPIPLPWY